MDRITNAKLPIGLVIAVVVQAMALSAWISDLQSQASGAQAAAAAAQERVADLEERLAQSEVGLAVLNDQMKMIVAEHSSIGDSLRQIWDEVLGRRSPAPVPPGTDRSYGY
jgi:uncharacterized coiled-coil protein SlyX